MLRDFPVHHRGTEAQRFERDKAEAWLLVATGTPPRAPTVCCARRRGGAADRMAGMKYNIWTVGCQMNVADSRKLGAGLDRAGCAAVDAIEDADLVVLNTCSVREHAEDRAIGQLG